MERFVITKHSILDAVAALDPPLLILQRSSATLESDFKKTILVAIKIESNNVF